MTDKLVTGSVVFYNKKRGFGMLAINDNKIFNGITMCFFHKTELVGDVDVGDNVVFSVVPGMVSDIDRTQKLTAKKVRRA
jgi:cold shock CspA family protein